MHPARFHQSISRTILAPLFPAIVTLAILVGAPVRSLAQQSNEILPLDQVHAGMQGYAYTIFAGDQVEKFDLEVLGIMPNFLGPKQSIILVQLKGPKVEHTGVVAGMSGSPVYLEGKLAGALSLKLGVFTKEPIAGVTPISDVLSPPAQVSAQARVQNGVEQFASPSSAVERGRVANSASNFVAAQVALPSGSALEPIETPLVFSGFQAVGCSANFLRNCKAMDSSPPKAAPPRRARMIRS